MDYILNKLSKKIFSRNIFQKLFETNLRFCLKMMNIGEGHDVTKSGEENVIKLLNNKKSDDKSEDKLTIFDVGAHKGGWFNLLKENCNKDYTCHSFEPSKQTFNELNKLKNKHRDDNKYRKLKTHNIALGEASKEERMRDTDSTGNNISKNGTQVVSMTTVDEFCKENNIKKIDLLKIDVEGYELKVLLGATEMLKNKKIELIQFEFGSNSEEKYSLKDMFKLLEKDFDIYRVLKHGLRKIEYAHYYEINTVTNFVAINKNRKTNK